jgi:hypothetical protein
VLTLLGYVGAALALIGDILLVIAAFRRGILWGLAVLLLPPLVGVLFAILHWREARRGVAFIALGAVLMWVGDLRYSSFQPTPRGSGNTVDL